MELIPLTTGKLALTPIGTEDTRDTKRVQEIIYNATKLRYVVGIELLAKPMDTTFVVVYRCTWYPPISEAMAGLRRYSEWLADQQPTSEVTS